MISTIQNSGQTPATFFEVHYKSLAIPRGEKMWAVPKDDFTITRWNALGGADTVTVRLLADDFFPTATEVSDANGKLTFFVVGKVRYGDVWGNVYETQFAYFVFNVSQTYKGMFDDKPLEKPYRKMSRAPGALKTFVLVETAKKDRGGWRAVFR